MGHAPEQKNRLESVTLGHSHVTEVGDLLRMSKLHGFVVRQWRSTPQTQEAAYDTCLSDGSDRVDTEKDAVALDVAQASTQNTFLSIM